MCAIWGVLCALWWCLPRILMPAAFRSLLWEMPLKIYLLVLCTLCSGNINGCGGQSLLRNTENEPQNGMTSGFLIIPSWLNMLTHRLCGSCCSAQGCRYSTCTLLFLYHAGCTKAVPYVPISRALSDRISAVNYWILLLEPGHFSADRGPAGLLWWILQRINMDMALYGSVIYSTETFEHIYCVVVCVCVCVCALMHV